MLFIYQEQAYSFHIFILLLLYIFILLLLYSFKYMNESITIIKYKLALHVMLLKRPNDRLCSVWVSGTVGEYI